MVSFFSSDFSLTAYVPLFVNYSLLPKNLELDFERIQRSLPWNAKPLPILFFGTMRLSPTLFRLCETFFRNFSNSSLNKCTPFYFFDVLHLNGCWKSLKGPLLLISRFFLENFNFFSKLFNFSEGSLLHFFWYFATNWIFKNPKESPLLEF